jgi:outer membrane biosynthesis protein TonB
MLAMILAAAAAVTAAPGPPAAPSPAAIPAPANILGSADAPRFLQRPSPQEFAAAYPHGAEALGVNGRAVLVCDVDRGGRLERCKVAAETPAGAGFGGAALGLVHAFRLAAPAAESERISFPIGFATLVNDNEQMATGPWVAAPTFADVAGAYPDIGGGRTGEVVMHCALNHDGSPRGCKVLYERPTDQDFGAAALKLAHFFRMQLDPRLLRTGLPIGANLTVRMAPPSGTEASERLIADPLWTAIAGPAQLTALFPAQAKAKGVTSGIGAADCTVGSDGALTSCQAGPDDPPGLGFSDAAVRAAQSLRMSPWTEIGGPVDGARVRLPLRFSLNGG